MYNAAYTLSQEHIKKNIVFLTLVTHALPFKMDPANPHVVFVSELKHHLDKVSPLVNDRYSMQPGSFTQGLGVCVVCVACESIFISPQSRGKTLVHPSKYLVECLRATHKRMHGCVRTSKY
mmetsp:Transcript_11507/g.20964  ORF Transcript_11507/g.20964 Transcript_11507/m.20964 type:complete len:121 (-) Transcript_11507:683-1045(-)